jgi:OOP family OmpA-OmpF porin
MALTSPSPRSPRSLRPSGRAAGVAAVLCGLTLALAAPARAEEGRLNVHLGLGAAVLANDAAARDVNIAGMDFSLKADYAAHRWVAPQVGYGLVYLPGSNGAEAGVNLVMFGARVRVLNDEGGYLANLWPKAPRGNAWGNLYVELGIGYAHAPTRGGDAHWAALELGVGYEFSLAGPLQIGPYVAYRQIFVKDTMPAFVTLGVSISFGLPKTLPRTAPRQREAPREEPEPPANIKGRPGDLDGDAVGDAVDKCPTTPPGAQVDESGCEYIRGKMVFDAIQFRAGTDRFAPGARNELRRVAEMIKANPNVSVEVGGHVDEPGAAEDTVTLSLKRARAIQEELQKHGVPAARITTRGFGNTAPVDPVRTDEARKANTRIEFRFSAHQPGG